MNKKSQWVTGFLIALILIVSLFLFIGRFEKYTGRIEKTPVIEGIVGQLINFSIEYDYYPCSNISTKVTSFSEVNSYELELVNKTNHTVYYQFVAQFPDQYIFNGHYNCSIDNFSLPYTKKITFDIQLPRELRIEEEKRMNFQQLVEEIKKHNQIISEIQKNLSSITQTLEERQKQDTINSWILKLKDICLIILFFLTITPLISKKIKIWINKFVTLHKVWSIIIVVVVVLIYFFSNQIVRFFIK